MLPDPTNGRYTHAILTDAGHAHLAEAAPGHVARVRDLVFDVLDPAELDNLRLGREAFAPLATSAWMLLRSTPLRRSASIWWSGFWSAVDVRQ